MVQHWQVGILVQSGILATFAFTTSAVAQIVPDNSLGVERSVVTPQVQSDGGLIDRIEGGAIRGATLFHSFQDFNVGELQRVYFANPTGIENILGRVTGTQRSMILGTLGVQGNANLFLINPNGILFGNNARLDIPGSFFAGTSEKLVLENGYEFGTKNPDSPPLLTINVPLGLGNDLTPQAEIINAGNLSTGADLTLVGTNLNLTGQLQAGKNLTLQASETIQVRDSVTNAFIAAAGQQFLAQAHKIDIFALNHPASGFFSGENMVFRSANPIGGNAHFSSGGNFLLQQLNGSLGDLSSVDDPVIRARGDVSFESYQGASLHIFAGGSVNIDTIEITNPDTTNFINETITLSDGVTQVLVNGSQEPTLDIRAGINSLNSIGIAGDLTGFSSPPNLNQSATRADITINQIITPGGLVFLTNQYQPNLALPGDITVNNLLATVDATQAGDVVIDSRGKIMTPRFLDTSGFDFASETIAGIGGNITLLAKGDIFMPFPSQIFSYGTPGGKITFKSDSAIMQAPATNAETISFIESATNGGNIGNDITLIAPRISLSSFVQNNVYEQGQIGGRLMVNAGTLQVNQGELSNVTVGGNAGNVLVYADTITLNQSRIGSQTLSTTGGNAGNVEIITNTLSATNGGQVFSSTEKVGNAGNLSVTAADAITLTGISETGIFSGFASDVRPDAQGNGGTIRVKTGNLSLREGAQIRASTGGVGNAGRIEIDATKAIVMDGAILLPIAEQPVVIPSGIISEVLPNSQGQGNVIDIRTGQLSLSNGAGISASTVASGDAGNIFINATESVSFDGNPGQPFKPTGAFVGTLDGATGKGGTLTINTPRLLVTNGAQLEALTESSEDAGNIMVNATRLILLAGADTGLFSNTTAGSSGNGGNILIDPEQVEIRNGAAVSVDSEGTGIGGSIEIQSNRLILDQGRISAETAGSDGGNITLLTPDLLLLRRGSQISATAGTASRGGNGGNITLTTDVLVAIPQENNDITANAFLGRGGNVDVTAQGIFGIGFQTQLSERSEITASSQFGVSGTVVINNPEVDPSAGLVELPENPSDPSDQIVVGCAAAEGNSFTITGRGGLPSDPTAPLRGQTLLSDLRDFVSSQNFPQSDHSVPNSSVSMGAGQTKVPLVEATRWIKNEQGQIQLVALSPPHNFPQNLPNCHSLKEQ
jgi:filamentous hemagglutinin family protein